MEGSSPHQLEVLRGEALLSGALLGMSRLSKLYEVKSGDLRCLPITGDGLCLFYTRQREAISTQQRVANLADLLKPHAGTGWKTFAHGPDSLSISPTRSNNITVSSGLGKPVILYLRGLGRDKKKVVASMDSAGVTVGDRGWSAPH